MALLPVEKQLERLGGMLGQEQPRQFGMGDFLAQAAQGLAMGDARGLGLGSSLGLAGANTLMSQRAIENQNREMQRQSVNDQLNMVKTQAMLEQQRRQEALQREQMAQQASMFNQRMAADQERFDYKTQADIRDFVTKQDQENAKRQMVMQYAQNLPQDQQILAMANPDEFLKNAIKGGKEPTDGQNIAAGFYDRMTSSGKTLNELDGVGSSVWQNIRGSTNMTASPEFQRVEQAQRDWINAQLRRESGAAIHESEFENARLQYFPVVGDSQEVIAQKKRNREIAENAMKRSAGRAVSGGMLGNGMEDPLGLR